MTKYIILFIVTMFLNGCGSDRNSDNRPDHNNGNFSSIEALLWTVVGAIRENDEGLYLSCIDFSYDIDSSRISDPLDKTSYLEIQRKRKLILDSIRNGGLGELYKNKDISLMKINEISPDDGGVMKANVTIRVSRQEITIMDFHMRLTDDGWRLCNTK
jgi:hypothetical protein